MSDEQGPLRTYLRRKQKCAAKIQDAYERARTLKRESIARDYQDLLAKLAEDRFTLAVVGQFKRGKSSLMNAIIGKCILPTGVLPVTAVVTILRYGARDRFMIQRVDGFMLGEVPLADLASYITHDGNPNNVKGVKHAILESPTAFLKNGFEFVDTPGVGSASDDSTASTYEFLRNCDAVLFVTAVEGPMNTLESNLLRAVREGGASTIIVVVNKVDLIQHHEYDALLRFVCQHAASVLGFEPNVFLISVQAALASPLHEGTEDPSGLARLQHFLSTFLSEQRAESFLASVENKFRAILTLDGEPSDAWGATTRGVAALAVSEHDAIDGHESANDAPDIAPIGWSIDPTTIEQPPPEEITRFLTERGCAVCAYLTRKSFDCFAHLQYELSVDDRSRGEFTRRTGFCTLHMWSLAAYSGPDGLSRILPPLANRLACRLRSFVRHPDTTQGELGELIITPDACAFCRFLRRHESAFVNALHAFLQSPSGEQNYDRSHGVCLRHLALLIGALRSDTLVAQTLRHAANWCDVLSDDMRSFALKRTALRRDRLNEDEEDAWRRFVVFTACDKRIMAPPSPR
jgi:GTP-binding protein EngB required for normal cell division